jgi:hypothetical protein
MDIQTLSISGSKPICVLVPVAEVPFSKRAHAKDDEAHFHSTGITPPEFQLACVFEKGPDSRRERCCMLTNIGLLLYKQ